MEILAEIRKGNLVIRLDGEFDMNGVSQFKEIVDHSLAQAHLKDVVVVMDKVPFIDSSGIGALLGRYRKVMALGGRIALCGVREPVEKVMQLSGVLTLMDLYQDEAEALAHFLGRGE